MKLQWPASVKRPIPLKMFKKRYPEEYLSLQFKMASWRGKHDAETDFKNIKRPYRNALKFRNKRRLFTSFSEWAYFPLVDCSSQDRRPTIAECLRTLLTVVVRRLPICTGDTILVWYPDEHQNSVSSQNSDRTANRFRSTIEDIWQALWANQSLWRRWKNGAVRTAYNPRHPWRWAPCRKGNRRSISPSRNPCTKSFRIRRKTCSQCGAFHDNRCDRCTSNCRTFRKCLSARTGSVPQRTFHVGWALRSWIRTKPTISSCCRRWISFRLLSGHYGAQSETSKARWASAEQ